MMPRVSVIVPAYNAAATIGSCIAALGAQAMDPSLYEVIVVDDGSTDETVTLAEQAAAASRADVRLVSMQENRGPAAARNEGVRAARGEILAFTDADCEAAPAWLVRGLGALDAEPALAAVEGRTDPKGEVGTLTHQMRNDTGGLWMTCNMLYRRDALERAGGFDERFRVAFLEDSDLAFAVMEDGGRIAWVPDAIVDHLVLHEGRSRFGAEARKRVYNALLYRKHPDLYARHIAGVVPALPPLHLKYMLSFAAFVASLALRAWPVAIAAALVCAFFGRRVAHAYRARDPISVLQSAFHPFLQTAWALSGAWRFGVFTLDL
jgi:glycosyltransferase involved in cell wall biosynthesis